MASAVTVASFWPKRRQIQRKQERGSQSDADRYEPPGYTGRTGRRLALAGVLASSWRPVTLPRVPFPRARPPSAHIVGAGREKGWAAASAPSKPAPEDRVPAACAHTRPLAGAARGPGAGVDAP